VLQAEIDLVLPLSEIIGNNAASAPHLPKPVSVQRIDVGYPPVETENCVALTVQSASSAESTSADKESSDEEEEAESADDESVAYILRYANANVVESDEEDDDACLLWGPAFVDTSCKKKSK